jgi:hypothetical protein
MLGELRGYREASGKFSLRTRYITLDETFPDDAAAIHLANEAREAEEAARNQSKQSLESWLENTRRSTPTDSGPGYVSSGACASCHQAAYIAWSSSAHAHATDPLPARWVEFESACLKCHATGENSEKPAVLQNVHCEQCHGPGGEHIKKPGKGYGRLALGQAMCTSCHTRDVQAGFDFAGAWAKIKH